MSKKFFLLGTCILVFIIPLFGSLAKWKGLPPGYGEFPAQKAIESPGLNTTYFIFGVIVAFLITFIFVFPQLFGFNKIEKKISLADAYLPFPSWFWWNLPVFIFSWTLMWAPIKALTFMRAYTFVPLMWSFILILDGIVYKRNQGVSLLSKKPATLKIIALVSCFGWFGFEYLNYFVIETWYYPYKNIFSNFGNIFWYALSFTTFLPAVFEWYLLLRTIPFFRDRYSKGPKFATSNKLLILCYASGVILGFGMGYYPFYLFWVIWIALVPMLVATMHVNNFWTPLTYIKNGNWSALILIALAAAFNGFFMELWNYGSDYFNQGMHTNPNYWKYTVPYLDKIHIFSEMPLLGYYGYLFFGIGFWIVWLTAAYLFNFDSDFDIIKGEK